MIAILYSPSQKAFHTERLAEYINHNIDEEMGTRERTDYRLLTLAPSGDTLKAAQIIAQLRVLLKLEGAPDEKSSDSPV